MIGRRLMGATTRENVDVLLGDSANKTLVVTIRANTGNVAYKLKFIVNGVSYSLRDLVLTELINPVVLVYCISNNSNWVLKNIEQIYLGGTTTTTSYADLAVIIGLKQNVAYSGVEVYSASRLNSIDRGMDVYLFNGSITTMLSNNISKIDILNKTTAAYTLGNIVSTVEFPIGAIPDPQATVYLYYDGNTTVRGAPIDEAMEAVGNKYGRCDVFGNCWLQGYGEFMTSQDRMCAGYTSVAAVPRTDLLIGTNDYPFSHTLYFHR